jgi:hypothetical protein
MSLSTYIYHSLTWSYMYPSLCGIVILAFTSNAILFRLKYGASIFSWIYCRDIGHIHKKRYLIGDGMCGLPDLVFVSPFSVTIIEVKGRPYHAGGVTEHAIRRKKKEEYQVKLYGGLARRKWPLKVIRLKLVYLDKKENVVFDMEEYKQLIKAYRKH